MNDKIYKLVIIGAGAAGLYAGAAAASLCRGTDGSDSDRGTRTANSDRDNGLQTDINTSDIIILEKMNSPGKKLLITGSGQCNLTHTGTAKELLPHYNDASDKIRKVLYSHSNSEVMTAFEKWGLPLTVRSDGKVFPKSMKSSDVLDTMLDRINRAGIKLYCNQECTSIQKDGRFWRVICSNHSYRTENILITSGGASVPATGSDGSLTEIIRKLGIETSELSPALVKVFVQNYPFSNLSGISFPNAELKIIPRKTSAFTQTGSAPARTDSATSRTSSAPARTGPALTRIGPVLLTHDALSGPCILDSSRNIFTGDTISINWISGSNGSHGNGSHKTGAGIVTQMFRDRLLEASSGSKSRVSTVVSETLKNMGFDIPNRFIKLQLDRLDAKNTKKSASQKCDPKTATLAASPAAETGKKMWHKIAAMFTEDTFSISGKGGFDEAMCTRGGVSLEHIDMKTMQSTTHPGIYFAGEVLNVDANTGGYNLQFAFSSAMCAVRVILSSHRS